MVKGRSLTQPPVQFRGAIAMIQVLAIAGGSEGAIAIKKTQKVKNLPVPSQACLIWAIADLSQKAS
jgi:hypothetical protein